MNQKIDSDRLLVQDVLQNDFVYLNISSPMSWNKIR